MIINFLCLFLEFSFSSLVYMVFLILQINYPLFIPSNFHHVSTGYSQVVNNYLGIKEGGYTTLHILLSFIASSL